ncbi:MAG: hypothetical protein HY347_12530, partial [candidate division NC10 bacterium]|nr:hypothetical protein [candidate division NC10 bacterium]
MTETGDREDARFLSLVSVSHLCLIFLFVTVGPAFSAPLLAPPEGFEAFDMPGDAGGSIGLIWKAAPYDDPQVRYQVFLADSSDGPFQKIAEFPASTHYKSDRPAPWWSWRRQKDVH